MWYASDAQSSNSHRLHSGLRQEQTLSLDCPRAEPASISDYQALTPRLPAQRVHARVSARGSPVVLVDCVSTGHITVAMASCPRPAPEGAAGGGSCLYRLALSASSPGDFRPVHAQGGCGRSMQS